MISLSIFLLACSNSDSSEHAKSSEPSVSKEVLQKDKKERSIRNVSVHLIKNKLDLREKNYVLLDVRTKGEFDGGYIPTAQWADIQEEKSFTEKIKELDRDATYYVYCQSGVRSKTAFDKMTDMGFTNVYNVVGGYSAWQEMMTKK